LFNSTYVDPVMFCTCRRLARNAIISCCVRVGIGIPTTRHLQPPSAAGPIHVKFVKIIIILIRHHHRRRPSRIIIIVFELRTSTRIHRSSETVCAIAAFGEGRDVLQLETDRLTADDRREDGIMSSSHAMRTDNHNNITIYVKSIDIGIFTLCKSLRDGSPVTILL